ncbi:MAG: Asp-tRNA(Asn)/Glu-tRNA(Gln) amidotransferase subunit GatC, partial [Candidatus Omnitrophica bacterium]|nr:Asp-tRNA(Asn)/Glu-tRNA(Gln) amidotransferase subunit GatC [Candidatus Omnitrophota bacterium]
KPEELDVFSVQLEEILKYMEKLNEAEVSHIPPTSHILSLKNVFRADQVRPSLDVDAVLENAPKKKDRQFSVPKVIA